MSTRGKLVVERGGEVSFFLSFFSVPFQQKPTDSFFLLSLSLSLLSPSPLFLSFSPNEKKQLHRRDADAVRRQERHPQPPQAPLRRLLRAAARARGAWGNFWAARQGERKSLGVFFLFRTLLLLLLSFFCYVFARARARDKTVLLTKRNTKKNKKTLPGPLRRPLRHRRRLLRRGRGPRPGHRRALVGAPAQDAPDAGQAALSFHHA